MGSPWRFVEFSVIVMLMVSLQIGSSNAYKFYVGGKVGWVLKPSEDYNHWAERNRFQVNDTLFFKYKRGSNSVVVVKKEDYESCNTQNSTLTLSEGDSLVTLDHSGPFFFISGNTESCNKGQKLHIVVMAVRHKKPTAPSLQPPLPSPMESLPLPPSASTPPLQSPTGGIVSDFDAPSPAPAYSGSHKGFGVISGWFVVCAVFGVSVVFGTFVGMV